MNSNGIIWFATCELSRQADSLEGKIKEEFFSHIIKFNISLWCDFLYNLLPSANIIFTMRL